MRRLVGVLQTIGTFASAAAWLFIVASLGTLSWAIASLWRDPSEPVMKFHTEVEGVSHEAWGLTYSGTMGLISAMVQAIVVVAASVASVLPARRLVAARRIGHVVLCAWAGLWAFNLLRMASLDRLPLMIGLSALLSVLALCTVYRALAGWVPGRSAALREVSA